MQIVQNMCKKSHFWSSLDFDSQLTSNRYDLVLLGKYAQLTEFETTNFRPNCHPEFFTLYLLACSYYSKLKTFTPQGLTRM